VPSTSRPRTLNNPRHYVGGVDLDPGDLDNASTAISSDGGQTWALTHAPPVTGAIFGQSCVSRAGGGAGGDPGRGRCGFDSGCRKHLVRVAWSDWLLDGSVCQSQSWLARGHGPAHSKDQFLAAVSARWGSARPTLIKLALQSGRPNLSCWSYR
jgi:hypothetical protein